MRRVLQCHGRWQAASNWSHQFDAAEALVQLWLNDGDGDGWPDLWRYAISGAAAWEQHFYRLENNTLVGLFCWVPRADEAVEGSDTCEVISLCGGPKLQSEELDAVDARYCADL